MPLNIDWQQILLHLLNFAILFTILYFLLYSPVKKFMKKREDYYKQIDESADKLLAEANEAKAEYVKKLANSDKEIEQKQKEAFDNLNASIAEQREEANKDAEKIIESAKKKAIKERENILQQAQSEIGELATKMAEKIVSGDDAYEDFLSDVESEKK